MYLTRTCFTTQEEKEDSLLVSLIQILITRQVMKSLEHILKSLEIFRKSYTFDQL